MGFFDKLKTGLAKSREKINESLNSLFLMGPDVDPEFWDKLEETLILADMGGAASIEIVEHLTDYAERKAIQYGWEVRQALVDQIAQQFVTYSTDPFNEKGSCILFVGINGAGKTTTVGKLAKQCSDAGHRVLVGSADTFRAAAIEQLDVWGQRAGVPIIKRERGADPASVCFDVLDEAQKSSSDIVLIDTAGRLHTSEDLMRELEKVVRVTRKRAQAFMQVYTMLVIDATTGQNGLAQAQQFNQALNLDGIILTKLDGTAKGGIAVAISHDLKLPVYRLGVGESLEDLKAFEPQEFARALVGDIEGDTYDE